MRSGVDSPISPAPADHQLRNKYSNKETTVLLKDFVTEDEDNPRHDNAQDLSRAEKPDTRKTRLTLEQISRLA